MSRVVVDCSSLATTYKEIMLEIALVRFLVSGACVLGVSMLMPGIRVKSYGSALWFAFMVGVVGTLLGLVVWPLKWIAGPIIRFFGRGLVFLWAQKLSSGVEIDGCLTASIAALIVTVVTEAVTGLLMHAP